MNSLPQDSHSAADQFERDVNRKSAGMFKELFHFLMHNKKWWLLPIILTLLLLGALVVLGGTAVAPFIYTLF